MRNYLYIPLFAVVLCLSFVQSLDCQAQRAKRAKLKIEKAGTSADTVELILSDAECAKAVTLSGYEKPLRATTESVFVKNRLDSGIITLLQLEITYFAANEESGEKGAQLHVRRQEVSVNIPAGQRRMVHFRSWDRNKVFYYWKNKLGKQRGQATPYSVAIRVKAVHYIPS